MKHGTVDDPTAHRLQNLGARKSIEGSYGTLPLFGSFSGNEQAPGRGDP
jgi:hypothetical protein